MLLLDSGGMPSASVIQHDVRPVAKLADGETSLYTVTVGRFLYENYTQEHVDVLTTTTFDATLEDAGLMVTIPGGTFQMGDVENVGNPYEKPVHTVTISTFEMSAYEITNAQYAQYLNEAKAANEIAATSETVTGSIGAWSGQEYIYLAGYDGPYWPLSQCFITYSGGTFSVSPYFETWPVTWVTWYGAKAFAEHYGIDLPREAEWEYASRWGNNQYEYGTDDGTISSSNANYYNSHGFHVAVGSYPANPFGLYDMAGNVLEWCADWDGTYPSESQTDPTGAQSGSDRVVRGGNWIYPADYCRSARRLSPDPGSRNDTIGFRVVRRPAQQ